MTKAELIEAVAEQAGVSKADAERTVGAFFDVVVSSAKDGDKVAWPGFGSFSTTQRAAREGRNPQTGAPVKIAASTAMKFQASSTLKSALNPNRK
jgi:DNA-binding protein HU-beta